jgi:hypothetical protein
MADHSPTASDEHRKLIERYKQSQSELSTARRAPMLLLFLIAGFYLIGLWSSVDELRQDRGSQFSEALKTQLMSGFQLETRLASPKLDIMAQLAGVVQRTLPIYVKALETKFDADWRKTRMKAIDELDNLDLAAQREWPKSKAGLLNLPVEAERVLQEELGRVIAPAEAKKVTDAFMVAFRNSYEEAIRTKWKRPVDAANRIGEQLRKLVSTEPKGSRAMTMPETVGVLLELAAIKLQSEGQVLATNGRSIHGGN